MLLSVILVLIVAPERPTLTFDPTAISSISCPVKYREMEGSYLFCRRAFMTFGRVRVGRPLPDSLRINYVDGLVRYYPGRCRVRNARGGVYECPDVMVGPREREEGK